MGAKRGSRGGESVWESGLSSWGGRWVFFRRDPKGTELRVAAWMGLSRRGRLKQLASRWLRTERVVFSPHWGRGASSPWPGQHLPRALLKAEWDEVSVFKNRTYGIKKNPNNLNGLKPKSCGLEKPLKKIHRGYRYYIVYYTLPVCTLWYIQ